MLAKGYDDIVVILEALKMQVFIVTGRDQFRCNLKSRGCKWYFSVALIKLLL